MVEPFSVCKVPVNGFSKSLFKGHLALPAKFSLDLCAVDGVALVVSGTVSNMGDCLFNFIHCLSRAFGRQLDYFMQKLDVLPFVFAADVVLFACPTVLEDEPYRTVVVFNVDPVADVVTLAIYRKVLSVADVADHEWQKFFWELVWSVVVRAV